MEELKFEHPSLRGSEGIMNVMSEGGEQDEKDQK